MADDEMWGDDDDLFNLTSDDVQSPEDLYKGGLLQKEGFYHVCVESSKMHDMGDDSKIPYLEVVLQVRAAEKGCESEVGKKTYVRFYLKKWKDRSQPSLGTEKMGDASRKALLRFLYGFTVIDNDQFGGDIKWHPDSLEQRQAIVKVEKEDDYEYEDEKTGEKKTRKGQFRVQWGNAWRLDDEEVAGVPKDEESLNEFAAYLAMIGEGGDEGGNDPLDEI